MEQYLLQAWEFLSKHAWVYDVKNTDIFVCDTLDKIPVEWHEPLLNLSMDELHGVPFGFCKDNWPASLQDFLKTANKLSAFRYDFTKPSTFSVENIRVPNFIKKHMPFKKIHEVKSIAVLIGDLTRKHSCGIVLDIGSGLGYLDQILHHNFGLVTVGFEYMPERSASARLRIKEGLCAQNMYHVNHKIEYTEECLAVLCITISDVLGKENTCNCGSSTLSSGALEKNVLMVGLHSCGNLTQDMMKLFNKLPEVKLFVCAGCCYHKIQLQDFPMSSIGKSTLAYTQSQYADWAPCTTGLRLGCQGTRACWSEMSEHDHEHQEKCLFYRAVLQQFLVKENLTWKKPKRHLRRDTDALSMATYIQTSFKDLKFPDRERKRYEETILKLAAEKEYLLPYIRIFNLLQVLLQPIWEAVIICDRMSYFEENSIATEVLVLWDELPSPRNLILYGQK